MSDVVKRERLCAATHKRHLVLLLNRLVENLKAIWDLRAYDEWTKEPLDVLRLVEQQENLVRTLSDLVQCLTCFYGFRELDEWFSIIAEMRVDDRTIDLDRLPRWAVRVRKAIFRPGVWIDQIQPGNHSCDVFLSYATHDSEPAKRIAEEAEESGISVFLSERQLEGGDQFAERIRDALKDASELWILASPASLKSQWVSSEWSAAWALNRAIVPILLGCGIDDLPEVLRRYQCVTHDEVSSFIERAAERVSAREHAQ